MNLIWGRWWCNASRDTGLCFHFVLCMLAHSSDGLGLYLLSEEQLTQAAKAVFSFIIPHHVIYPFDDLVCCWYDCLVPLSSSFFIGLECVKVCFFPRCHSHVVLTWPLWKVSDLDLAVCRCGAVFCDQGCWDSCKQTPGTAAGIKYLIY